VTRSGADPGGVLSGRRPWEIEAPQPALLAVCEAGALQGRVLDVGCGSGEHTLMAAAAGLDATGIDQNADVLALARRKACERGLTARFLRRDATRLQELDEVFDTTLDSLFVHALSPAARLRYLAYLRAVLRPGGRLFVLCYSDGPTPEPVPPHRMSRDEVESCFADGWALDSLRAVRSASVLHPDGVPAWLAVCTRI
jgi:SAM-dependent methyltransferase